jgi:DNA-binding CsgD family transcriptional regulator/endogenous inhibitor of DNA gyrase (YacG/DUF329 family)
MNPAEREATSRFAGFFFFATRFRASPWLMVKAERRLRTGGDRMTKEQKQRIEYLRGKGDSYAVIATALGISENTVKSHCRRNNLVAGCIAELSAESGDSCENCGKPLEHTTGAKRKRFCSDKCRLAWWNAHPEKMNQRAVYRFNCKRCGTPFAAYGNKGRKYCSHACYAADRFGKGAAL